jgi:cysteine-rich repeat protein
MVVGAQFDDDKGTDSGSIYVYPRVNGVWYEKQKITASDGAGGDRFGVSVSIHGPCMVVGASWDDDKGDRSGAAYGLTRVNGVWVEAQKVTASDGAGGDWFGWSASIFDFTLVVGAMGDDDKGSSSGSAYVFDLSPNCLTPDTCECKPGYVGPTCADTECGDNITAGDEVCDDGNNVDGDGCSAVCEAELAPECLNYKSLDDPTRNINYGADGCSDPCPGGNCACLCDHGGGGTGFSAEALNGWVRLEGASGTRLSESCVPSFQCKTQAPGWMVDAHPTVKEGQVDRQVCFTWSGNCCWESATIKVRNCGDYYVYNFPQAPTCYLRYCGTD